MTLFIDRDKNGIRSDHCGTIGRKERDIKSLTTAVEFVIYRERERKRREGIPISI